jgi:hypothetical protein
MFSKLLRGKNRIDGELPEERLKAIAALDEEQAHKLEEQLHHCATSDADVGVRKAAIVWANDKALLLRFLDDSGVAETAAARLIALGEVPDHPVAFRLLMRTTTQADDAMALLDRAADANLAAELFCAAPEQFRDQLLAKLSRAGEASLAALEKFSRNRDKNCNRLARVELDRLRSLVKTVDVDHRRAEELAEALRGITADGSRKRLEHLKRELETNIGQLEGNAEQMSNYGLSAPDVREFRLLLKTAEIATTVAAPQPMPEPQSVFEPLISDLESLDSALAQLSAADGFHNLESRYRELIQHWEAVADQVGPSPDHETLRLRVGQRYDELSGALDRMQRANLATPAIPTIPDPEQSLPDDPAALQSLWAEQRELQRVRKATDTARRNIRWPKWAVGIPVTRELEERIASLSTAIECLDVHKAKVLDAFATAVGVIAGCVEDGQLQPALSALGQARRLEKSLPDNVATDHRKALLREAARIEELKDWQNFATSPKREPLIESLQAIISSPLEPKIQADKIKAIRAEWNALGPATGHRDRTLAVRFNELAEEAFEPCRSYFSEQASIRKQNLLERQRICDQLEEYMSSVDWATTDMKAAEQIMRAARNEWRGYHPVDRSRGKKLEAAFEDLQGQIHARVKKAWADNLDKKRQVVADAETLVHSDADNNAKVEGAKSLQRRWREIGITPRKPDQDLWREFRRHCDSIFTTRDVDKAQADQEIASAIAQAESICDELQAALDITTPATADKAQLSRMRGELHALRLPERRERGLHKRFDDLARDYNQLLRQKQMDTTIGEINQIKAWDLDMSQAEVAGQPV